MSPVAASRCSITSVRLTVRYGRRRGRERVAEVDSDLADGISALKSSLEKLGVHAVFANADASLLESLGARLGLPRRYREFLGAADPVDVETATPTERVRLVPSAELLGEQVGYCVGSDGERITQPSPAGWRPTWVIIGISALLGDPYFIDVSDVDAEGDCPVFSAMSGTEKWEPKLCASGFASFLRILGVTMEVAKGFDLDDYDIDDEQVFREAIGPEIRLHDPAALKSGHWT
jgi:hypothetical protein